MRVEGAALSAVPSIDFRSLGLSHKPQKPSVILVLKGGFLKNTIWPLNISQLPALVLHPKKKKKNNDILQSWAF